MDDNIPALPDDIINQLNGKLGGFADYIGIRFTSATYECVEADIPVGPQLFQPYGLVHGGVYASIVETLASIGASLHVMHVGKQVVGLENTTTFLKATSSGVIKAKGHALTVGRRTHLWEVNMTNEHGKLVASGRVRLLVLEQNLGDTIPRFAPRTP